jgi:hypothetical protein
MVAAHVARAEALNAAHRRGWQRRMARRDPEAAAMHRMPALAPAPIA